MEFSNSSTHFLLRFFFFHLHFYPPLIFSPCFSFIKASDTFFGSVFIYLSIYLFIFPIFALWLAHSLGLYPTLFFSLFFHIFYQRKAPEVLEVCCVLTLVPTPHPPPQRKRGGKV